MHLNSKVFYSNIGGAGNEFELFTFEAREKNVKFLIIKVTVRFFNSMYVLLDLETQNHL